MSAPRPAAGRLEARRLWLPPPAVRRVCCGLLCLGGGLGASVAAAAELSVLENVALVDFRFNDGDSFMVRTAAGQELYLRLYFVDSPESGRSDAARIREQQRHFGLASPRAVVKFGERAAEQVRELLARPFTVRTAYALAPGRAAANRYYAFVQTHDGRDLAHLLVEQGLARVHGKTRAAPDGAPSQTVLNELQDLRAAAQLERVGIWGETDSALLVKLRAEQRRERRQLEKLRQELKDGGACPDRLIDINRAAAPELEKIPGIGPVTAAKIIAGRPYRSLADLRAIPGIGEKTLARIAPCADL